MKIKLIILLISFTTILSSCESSLFAGADVRGYFNSTPENSMFGYVDGMDIDKEGNLYLADTENNVIRKVTPDGFVSTFAGTGKQGDKLGKKEEAEFNNPFGLKFDQD